MMFSRAWIKNRNVMSPKPMTMMIWKIQVGMPANSVLPACCSDLMNVIAARIRKKQIVPANRLTIITVILLAVFDSSRDRASILMCRSSLVASEAPMKPIQSTRWRSRVSAQRIEVWKKFLKMTCRNASRIMVSRMVMRKTDSILAIMLLAELINFIIGYFSFISRMSRFKYLSDIESNSDLS